jgi:lysyl-tRNA synthetase class 1
MTITADIAKPLWLCYFSAMTHIDRQIAQACRTWAFEEAKAILARLNGQLPAKGYVLFETGYGPSGLPHIGTFGEVCRTSMVMEAFKALSDMPVKMICFSDDMDGLRKVPDNVPNPDMLAGYIGKPLTRIPDPFGTHESFGHHNNARLRAFLDQFGFKYEFLSATDMYTQGRFDETLLKMLAQHEAIKKAVLPILGPERAATYSPFLPVSPATGKVLQVPVLEAHADKGTIVFDDEDGTRTEVPVTGGAVKAQWRADWALRWYALDVDYEMSGVDLKSSAEISGKIVQILGKKKPAGFHYELFLDEQGEKISKSKGNGLSMEEWLTYAPHESLAYYMFQRPSSAKKLYFDIIPKAVDEYITFIDKFAGQDDKAKLDNPAWYIHGGRIPNSQHTPISFALLLNLASAANAHSTDTLWGFIRLYSPGATPDNAPFLDRLVGYALKYYEDFVLPAKRYRLPDERERAALTDLAERLKKLDGKPDSEALQTEVFSAGKENGYGKEELREWFQALYQVLLGQDQGPRFGSFIALYGRMETVALIEKALEGGFMAKAA